MSPEELAAAAKKRTEAALGPTDAPGTISNDGVVPGKSIDVPVTVIDVSQAAECAYEQNVLSVTIGATISLGKFSNVKLEVQATDGASARASFSNEIKETVALVQSVIRALPK